MLSDLNQYNINMAIQLVFSKSDDAPWGFRLTGGADCEIPLTVIKVAEGGIADHAGLHVGDVIININDCNMEERSHIEAHDVLMEAGQCFTMTVIRNDENSSHDEEQHNEEIRSILKHTFDNQNYDGIQSGKVQDVYQEIVKNEFEELPQPKSIKVHFEKPVSESCNMETQQAQEVKQKKWSTFLQKPDRPKLLKKEDIVKPIGEPYRVIIKKQPKRDPQDLIRIPVQEPQVDIESQDNYYEVHEDVRRDTPPNEIEIEEETMYLVPDENEEQEQLEIDEVQEDHQSDEEPEEARYEEEPEIETQVSLEMQLALIQQQLQSLAQVPTSIQTTLETLTEQLAKIVGVPQAQQNVEQAFDEDEDDERADNDDNLPSIVEEGGEALDSSDEYKLDITDTTDISEDEADNNSQYSYKEIELTSAEDELKLKQAEEAERERQQLEYEKSLKQERTEEFHQRRLEQRPTIPLASVQRPIILPGGRKWSEPDDALPKPRKSKMTDEKICETLDNYSEIIAGHTKGINFLKYQPAPKNLDYLQRSEVFKLIHDTDPPKSGIAARTGTVASEEDYYRNNPMQYSSVKV